MLPLLLAVGLLWAERVPGAFLNERLFPWAPWEFWVAAFVAAAGMLFTVWARVHLGGNWSGIVTIKHDHELIASGPYAIVRHPIYTGLLVAFIGSAMARGEWRGVLAVLIAWVALWRKLRLEERWMAERFGQQYEAYCRRGTRARAVLEVSRHNRRHACVPSGTNCMDESYDSREKRTRGWSGSKTD